MSPALAESGTAAVPDVLDTPLDQQLDDLCTRMMLDGPSTVTAAGLEQLSRNAAATDRPALAEAASQLAAALPALHAEQPAEQLADKLNDALALLRTLLLEKTPHPTPAPAQPLAAVYPQAAAPAPVVSVASLAEDRELVLEFLTESREHLVHIESQMLELEKDAGASETLNAVFRAFHTIKGLAGFLEFASIQALAHQVETLLDLARNGELSITSAVVDLILESADIMRRELSAIESSLAGEPPQPTSVTQDLLGRLHNASHGIAPVPATQPAPEAFTPPAAASAPALTPELAPSPQPAPTAASVATPEPAPKTPAPTPPPATQQAPAAQQPAAQAASSAKPGENATVRIETGKLDQLMDLVGELVIAQTLIGHSPALSAITNARLQTDLTQLERITADVQRVTTAMRMVPIGTQFQKTARVIRDLSRRAGKQIVLETSGDETEIDKSIAEELSDPLLHMVRNSVDHGIETTDERLASGKDPIARVRLSASHESGQIVISISDDGRGLNREKILKRAIERELIQPGAQLTDNEIFLLIFEPGFSTAEAVTDISGRGVGMDVVKRHVQKLRGRIEVQSAPGQGTTFLLKLPLTLAIIEGLVVLVGEQRYIVPIFAVREMFRPTPEQLSTVQGRNEMVMVRGGLLPIVRLHERFSTLPRTTALTDGMLIVAEAESRQFCLFVDDLVNKQEVVIKGLGSIFKDVVGVAGCAILGDGRVGLILDMLGIFRGAR